MLGAPKTDPALQVVSQQSKAEGQNPFPQPAAYAAGDGAQEMVG